MNIFGRLKNKKKKSNRIPTILEPVFYKADTPQSLYISILRDHEIHSNEIKLLF